MTEIAVWVAGVVGLSIVLRAGALYSGTDRLALMLVLLIGVGFALGIYELAMRARRALKLAREIEALPPTPSESDLDALSPEIGSTLRARIAGMPASSAPPPYASYLLGLLVMIGLLGTFMGLFESLRGARDALGSSGDVTALRASLAAPMTGLSRAFGTSAAGVTASAMLGLALVIVRRTESRVATSLSIYASGPLAALTVARRTLDALEAIARQGAALPAASEAITRGANAMTDVARDVGAALERTTSMVGDDLRGVATSVRDDLRGVASSVRDDLRGASAASARAVADAVTPSLESAITRVLESTAAQTSSTIARFDAASEARIAREIAHADALGVKVDRAVESVLESHRSEAAALRESIGRDAKVVVDTVLASRELLAEAEADRARAIAETMRESATSVASELREATTALATKLSDTATAVATELSQATTAVATELSQATTAAATQLADTTTAATTRLADTTTVAATQLAATTAAMSTQLRDSAGTVSAELVDTNRALAKSFEALFARVDAATADLAASRELMIEAEAERARVTAVAEAERARSLAATMNEAVASVGVQFRASTVELAKHLGDAIASTELALDGATSKSAERFDGLLARLSESAAQMTTASSATAEHLASYVEKLAAMRDELRADDDARAERLAASTETRLQDLATTVSAALATSMEHVVASARAAPEAAAAVIAESAERLRREGEANAERDVRLELLVERLDAVATAIDARGTESTERVSELTVRLRETYEKSAAALERGGVDLTSTAELFGASVDRYREASDKWMTGLSVMRAAAERAAQGDTQDMLAAYLEQTREVFEHTVQFQRQLFNELRRVSEPREFAPTRLLATGTEGAEAEE